MLSASSRRWALQNFHKKINLVVPNSMTRQRSMHRIQYTVQVHNGENSFLILINCPRRMCSNLAGLRTSRQFALLLVSVLRAEADRTCGINSGPFRYVASNLQYEPDFRKSFGLEDGRSTGGSS